MIKDFSKYCVLPTDTVFCALQKLNDLSSEALVVFIIDAQGRVVGTLTDGDIRRALLRGVPLNDTVESMMNVNFAFISENEENITEKVKSLKERNIAVIPLLDSEMRILDIYNLKKIKSILPVDAVLMAGGKGERLRPLTEHTPKPLLKIGNKAIIDYNVERLITYGVDNISVTVNYLKEQIIDHFAVPINDVKVKCVTEPCYLGTIGSLKFVQDYNHDTVMVMNSDLFTNVRFDDFYLHFRENNADMSVAAIPYSVSVPYGIFDLDGRNIKSILEKPTYNYYANAGIYLIKRSILDKIPENKFFNATDLIEKLIAEGLNVIRFPVTGYWIDIGKHEEYKKAQELVKHL